MAGQNWAASQTATQAIRLAMPRHQKSRVTSGSFLRRLRLQAQGGKGKQQDAAGKAAIDEEVAASSQATAAPRREPAAGEHCRRQPAAQPRWIGRGDLEHRHDLIGDADHQQQHPAEQAEG